MPSLDVEMGGGEIVPPRTGQERRLAFRARSVLGFLPLRDWSKSLRPYVTASYAQLELWGRKEGFLQVSLPGQFGAFGKLAISIWPPIRLNGWVGDDAQLAYWRTAQHSVCNILVDKIPAQSTATCLLCTIILSASACTRFRLFRLFPTH